MNYWRNDLSMVATCVRDVSIYEYNFDAFPRRVEAGDRSREWTTFLVRLDKSVNPAKTGQRRLKMLMQGDKINGN